jgi:frataxin
MASSSFETLADRTLQAILERVEERLEDAAEADLQGGILSIELDDGRRYVINKHAPNRQIWLSSPVSGAAHFDWHEGSGEWRSTRGGETLLVRLAQELTAATGTEIAFG